MNDMVIEDELDGLAFRFLKKFARIECALKASGFHNGNGDAKANWDTFANSVSGKLELDPQLKDAIDYISKTPPKKQIIKDDLLQWSSPNPNANKTHELLLCVRRVRNNLFHGGKFNGHWFAPERSKELIEHSLNILDACLRHSEKLQIAYQD